VPYSPLGRGFLTGRFQSQQDLEAKDFRKLSPRFQEDNMRQNWRIVEGIRQIAAQKGCTAGQLALAWVLAKGEDLVPIPGTKRLKYLDENIRALDVTLTAADLKALEEIAPLGITAGTRYPEQHMRAVGI